MKTMSLRAFAREAPVLTEAVLITHDRKALGQFRPIPKLGDVDLFEISLVGEPPHPDWKVSTVDDVAKKAIEPDKVKVKRGIPTKGLGDLPGEEPHEVKPTLERDPYKDFRPAPKPGKSK